MVYIGPLLDPSFSFNVLFRAVDVVNFNWRRSFVLPSTHIPFVLRK